MQYFKWPTRGLKLVVCATALCACAEQLADVEPGARDDQPDAGEMSASDPLAHEAPGADAGADSGADSDAQSTEADADSATTDADSATTDADSATTDADSATTDADTTKADAGKPLDQKYAQAYALMTEHCVSCHGAGKPLDMSSPELAHEQLVGVAAGYRACAADGGVEKIRVVAGSPSESLLMEKLENRQTCGKQMPTMALLAPAEVSVFRAWIEAGAKLY